MVSTDITQLSDTQRRLVAELLVQDRSKFIKYLVQIEDKQRHPQPFELNTIQADMATYVPIPGGRHTIVKPSQVGASSYCIADFLIDTITTPGTTSVIVAHEEFITQRLLTKAQSFYDSIPDDMKPEMAHKSSHEKSFPEIHSVFYIGSARAFVFGRGEVIHNFLADEYAFWPNTSKIMVPTLQRVPPEGRVLVLSTPNGEDNDFHDLYVEGKSPESNWESHFYHWMEHKEYQIGPGSPLALPADRDEDLKGLTDQEVTLLQSRSATPEQIRWRRYKNAEMSALRRRGDGVNLFGQEFPEDDVTCFLAAGDMVYDPDLVDELARGCYDSVETRSFLPEMPSIKTNIWELPQEGMDYQIGIDPGQAKFTETVITVWRFELDEDNNEVPTHCATYAGLLETDETARLAIAIGRVYNTALISCESNGHGLAVLNGLRGYPRLYHRIAVDSGKRSRLLGWVTSNKTKPFMIKETMRLMPWMRVFDIRLVSQFRNIRWTENFKGEKIATSIGHDDIHDSTAIAMACRETNYGQHGFVGATSGWD